MNSSKGITASRLQLLESHLTADAKHKIADDAWASINGDEFLSQRGIQWRKNTREFIEALEPKLIEYTNKTEFPFEAIDGLRKLGINGLNIKDYGGPGMNTLEAGVVLYELAKVEPSLYTFMTVQNSIGMACIDILGNEE